MSRASKYHQDGLSTSCAAVAENFPDECGACGPPDLKSAPTLWATVVNLTSVVDALQTRLAAAETSAATWKSFPMGSAAPYCPGGCVGYDKGGNIDNSNAPQYMLQDGIVHLKGCVGSANGEPMFSGCSTVQLPVQFRPKHGTWQGFLLPVPARSVAASKTNSAWVSYYATGSNGWITPSATENDWGKYYCFDGASFEAYGSWA
jgi:hypothetical protein